MGHETVCFLGFFGGAGGACQDAASVLSKVWITITRC